MVSRDIKCVNGEIQFDESGDISITHNANIELAQCLILTTPGEFKQFPQSGIDIRQYINSPITPINQQLMRNKFKKSLVEDGFDVLDFRVEYNINLKDYIIKINGNRTR